jgi:hypothetical protein
MAGIISFAGYDGAVYLMGWTGGYVLLALLLAPYLRKFGKFTVPDFIGDRYYSKTARIVSPRDASSMRLKLAFPDGTRMQVSGIAGRDLAEAIEALRRTR